MSIITKGNISVQMHGLLKHKPLPGSYGVLIDGDERKNIPPRLELFQAANQPSPVHVIHLQHLKFSTKSIHNEEESFVMSIKKEKHSFQFETKEDKEDWVWSLCHVSTELWNQLANAKELSDFDESETSKEMEENLVYDSSERVQQFKVSIKPTRASESNGLKGHFLLCPNKENLSLLDITTMKSIHEWPYRQIRKYGRSRNIFRMEVGRRCSTGEGEFEFFTPDGDFLARLVALNANAVREKEGRLSQDEISHSSPQRSPVALIPRRVSESHKDTSEEEHTSGVPSRSSSLSMSGKLDYPKPAPRSKFVSSPKQEKTSAKDNKKETVGNTKIYETSSGLTAPLESNLREELSNKLLVSNPSCENAQLLNQLDENNDACLPIEGAESDIDKHSSGGTMKDKKKHDKEKKRLEKEQKAEQKKQEKEREKEKERLAKEQKEREKQQKKSHTKLTGKKSNTPKPAPAAVADGGNIYDEPEELLQVAKTKDFANTADPTYDEAGYPEARYVTPKSGTEDPLKPLKPAPQQEDMYALPEKPKKDGWKKHAMTESEDIHQEDYSQIKLASMSQASSHQPSSPHLQFPKPGPAVDDDNDTYNHLGFFDQKRASQPSENVYGMASAVQTVQPDQSLPVASLAPENEYEEANTINPMLSQRCTYPDGSNEYEITDVQPFQTTEIICSPDTGEYAEVK